MSRVRALVATLAIALLVTSGGVAQAYDPPTRSPFTDVTTGHVFYRHIAWLADEGISTGYGTAPGRTFEPTAPVLREQMAAFLYRLAGQPDYTPPRASPFIDVTPDHVFYKHISWLADQGISTGYEAGGGLKEFRPGQPVLREQMAAFLYRFEKIGPEALILALGFTDVPTNHAFRRQIDWLADRQITTGYPGPPHPSFPTMPTRTFQPSAPVLREQMAAFMFRLRDVDGALAPPVDVVASASGEVGTPLEIELLSGSPRFGAPDEWSVHSGTLPPGLTIRLADAWTGIPAAIHGRPWAAGTYETTLRFRDEIGRVAYRDLTVTVTDPQAVPAEDAVTRAELAQDVFDELRPAFDAPATSPFTDVATDHPNYVAAAWAHATGVITDRGGSFEPDATMTRAEFAEHGYRADETTFEQVPQHSPLVDLREDHPQYDQLHWAHASGILLTTGDDLIVPARLASRKDSWRLQQILTSFQVE